MPRRRKLSDVPSGNPMLAQIAKLAGRVDEHDELFELHDERLDRHERDIAELDRDISILRAMALRARQRAVSRARMAVRRRSR